MMLQVQTTFKLNRLWVLITHKWRKHRLNIARWNWNGFNSISISKGLFSLTTAELSQSQENVSNRQLMRSKYALLFNNCQIKSLLSKHVKLISACRSSPQKQRVNNQVVNPSVRWLGEIQAPHSWSSLWGCPCPEANLLATLWDAGLGLRWRLFPAPALNNLCLTPHPFGSMWLWGGETLRKEFTSSAVCSCYLAAENRRTFLKIPAESLSEREPLCFQSGGPKQIRVLVGGAERDCGRHIGIHP